MGNPRNQPTSSTINLQLSFTQPPQLLVAASPSGTAHGGVTAVTAGQDCGHPNVYLPPSRGPPLQPGCLLCLDPSRHTYSVKSCVLRFFSSFAHSAPKQNWYGYKLKDSVPRSKHLCWAWWLLVLIRTCYGPQQRCFLLAHLCQHLFSMKGRTSSSTREKHINYQYPSVWRYSRLNACILICPL